MSNNTLRAEVRFSFKGETHALDATYNPIRMGTLGGWWRGVGQVPPECATEP